MRSSLKTSHGKKRAICYSLAEQPFRPYLFSICYYLTFVIPSCHHELPIIENDVAASRGLVVEHDAQSLSSLPRVSPHLGEQECEVHEEAVNLLGVPPCVDGSKQLTLHPACDLRPVFGEVCVHRRLCIFDESWMLQHKIMTNLALRIVIQKLVRIDVGHLCPHQEDELAEFCLSLPDHVLEEGFQHRNLEHPTRVDDLVGVGKSDGV
jgi:hypothetical protein